MGCLHGSSAFLISLFTLGWAGAALSAPILLKSGTLTPTAGTAKKAFAASALAAAPGTGARAVYLIQHDGVIDPDWRRSLEASGAVIRGYIPENAYLIEVTPAALAAVEASVPHSYLGAYRPASRMDGTAAAVAAGSAATVQALAAVQERAASAASNGVFTVSVFEETGRGDVSAAIAALDGCRVVREGGTAIRAELTAAGVAAVSRLESVSWIEPYYRNHLLNDMAVQAPRLNVTAVWPGGASGLGLTGAGQVIAVGDSGLDTGNLATLHADVRGRVTRVYSLVYANDWSDTIGHGTHVAGSLVGDGTMSGGAIKGVAYGASLIVQAVVDSEGYAEVPADLASGLFSPTYAASGSSAGARIHSDSWGNSSNQGTYTTDAKNVDAFTFAHPDFLSFFAAGNEAADVESPYGLVDLNSMDAPGTAKNCVTVGASESGRASGGYSQFKWYLLGFLFPPISSDYISRPYTGGQQGMAAISGRGPCGDNRMKPDVVAPGTDILSLKSSLYDVEISHPSLSYNNYYMYMTGTSMATPLAAGCGTLVREWLARYRGIADPLGSTIKALLIAGAKSLYPGQYGTGTYQELPDWYPNPVEGFGQISLGRTLTAGASPFVRDHAAITQGQTDTYTVLVPSNNAPFCAVMAYADAPAQESAARSLVNDLDLTLTQPDGTLVYPNTNDGADNLNNVEAVRYSAAPAGLYTLRVTGTSIPMPMADSVSGSTSAQLYSLVACGAQPLTNTSYAVQGPRRVESEKTAAYTNDIVYNGIAFFPLTNVTWSVAPAEHAAIDSRTGVLTVGEIVSNQQVIVTARGQGESAFLVVTLTPLIVQATFDAAGGTPARQTVEEGYPTPTLLPEVNPTRSGYAFNGWWTAKSGGEQVTPATIVSSRTAYTLYAHWLKTYTLTVRNGTIDGQSSPVARVAGAAVSVQAVAPSASTNWVFSAWTCVPDSSGWCPDFNLHAETVSFRMPTSNLALTASYLEDPGYLTVRVLETNGTANVSQTPVGIQWSLGDRLWNDANDGAAYPVRSGTVSLVFRSTNACWLAPKAVKIQTAGGRTDTVTVWAMRVAVVSPVSGDSGTGTVSRVPASGQVLNGRPVQLSARAAEGSLFVDWRDDGGNRVSSAASFAVSPARDTTYTARFRLAKDCESPVLAVAASESAYLGVAYAGCPEVQDLALPVKFTARNLPPGLKMDAVTGSISGVPSRAGTYRTVITASSVANARSADAAEMAFVISPLPAQAVGTFNGSAGQPPLASPAGRRALVSLAAGKTGQLACRILSTNGTTSLRAAAWSAVTGQVFYASLTAPKGETLGIAVDTSLPWTGEALTGMLSNGVFSAGYAVAAQRVPFSKTGRDYEIPEAMNALAPVAGYYTLAIPLADVPNEQGAAQAVPEGYGYGSLTVRANGAAALAGRLADGARYSASGLIGFETNGAPRFDFFIPLYRNRGFWCGRLHLGTAGGLDGAARWRYPGSNPVGAVPAVEDRFDVDAFPDGAWYNTAGNLAFYYTNTFFSAATTTVGYVYSHGAWTSVASLTELPDNVAITADSRGTLKIPSARAPVYDRAAGRFVFDATNAACVTFAATKATGLFGGTFNLYYAYQDENAVPRMKTVREPYQGILSPACEPMGRGYYRVPDTWGKHPIQRSSAVEINGNE